MRHLMPRTYYPFFARFRHPSLIQERAAQPLLNGESILLVSATASGKTEAFLAPLVERHFQALKSGQGQILFVCPTRALVNDAARRLAAPLRGCGLQLRRRTSDASENPETQEAAVWITTPEGLDSLLCRFPRWLGRTQALILDEIHLLHGTPRGTQVLCLLERLDWVCKALSLEPPQRVGATATAAQPQALARSFLGATARVIEDNTSRPIRLHYDRWIDYATLRDTLADIPQARKVLLFANSRAEAEEAAEELSGKPPFGRNTWVHHSSLSRTIRLAAEQAFLRQDSGLLACTTTMEVGVDVGDVDWVVLLHPPEERLSFLQRCGRSGRRSGPAQAVAVWRSQAERLRYQYYLQGAKEKWGPPVATPQHDSVVPQQALSLLWQNPRKQVSGQALHQRLPQELAARWDLDDLEEQLRRLQEKGWIEANPGSQPVATYGPGRRLERLAKLGQLHGNIGSPNQKQVEIRDAFTGQVLGSVQADARGRVPARLRLGGRSHQLRQDRQQKTLLASPLALAPDSAAPATGPAAPTGLSSSQEFASWLGLAPRCLLSGPQGNLLGHFLGSSWGSILRRHLEQNYPGSIFYADAYIVAWQGSFVEEVWNEEALWGCVQKFSQQIRNQLQLGRWFGDLSKKRQRQELSRLLHWDWVKDAWLQAPFLHPTGEALEKLKLLLQQENDFSIAGFFPIEAEDL